jgi:L-seryl-tRNA(Ser) seleniumtransferase
MGALQDVALSYLRKTVCDDLAFWKMVARPLDGLRTRAEVIVAESGTGSVVDTEALPGAGSAPGITMPSIGVTVDGDHLAELRSRDLPIIARTRDHRTILDLRSVDPDDDGEITDALRALGATS